MDSDSSGHQTTYSEEERRKEYIRNQRHKRKLEKERTEAKREEEFENYFYDNINDDSSIFNWPGINFLDFTHLKVKFKFVPAMVVTKVKKDMRFYCSMYWKYDMWYIRKHTLPLPCAKKIYANKRFSAVTTLDALVKYLTNIYKILVDWSVEYEKFKWRMYNRYLQDKNTFLFSDDEELFLTEEEIQKRRERRNKIFERMKPPDRPQSPKRKLRLARLHLL